MYFDQGCLDSSLAKNETRLYYVITWSRKSSDTYNFKKRKLVFAWENK